MNLELLKQAQSLIARHEGLRLKPYRCSAGKLTLGYGRNLEDNGISKEEATLLLRADVEAVHAQLSGQAWFEGLNSVRQLVVMDMCFNLGFTRFNGFKKMIEALRQGDHERAAHEMLNSLWAKQVKGRAVRLADMMRHGE